MDPSVFLRRFDLYQICISWFTVFLKIRSLQYKFNVLLYDILFDMINLIRVPLHRPNSSSQWICDIYDSHTEPNQQMKITSGFSTFVYNIRLHQWIKRKNARKNVQKNVLCSKRFWIDWLVTSIDNPSYRTICLSKKTTDTSIPIYNFLSSCCLNCFALV